ncbi:glycosyltransferase family 4 protein [Polynucleobacter antarcticus]|uniref:glycosyltransferase family 4 protein n=1 Tax=Polynucleobacter antarcticus TaxID=1743162 RepID=UPI0026701CC0|nr:glycosyltransferase family 4 protein [Polynucleobacter antarcticus]
MELLSLGYDFPYPSQETIAKARQLLLNLRLDIPVVMDGLALGVLPEIVAELATRHPIIALIHHPLALETGLSIEQADILKASEALSLRHVKQVIVNSPTTAQHVAKFLGVQEQSIQVVFPGTDRPVLINPPEISPLSPSEGLHLLSVGSVIHRKGFDVLIAALQPLADLPWTLSIAGDISRDDVALKKLQEDIHYFGFKDRVHVLGVVTAEHMELLYGQADIFVLASRFEGYGMAYAEALARGLPVIGTNAGAISETVPAGAGLLVPPDDIKSLTAALRKVMQDRNYRFELSQGARKVAAQQSTWEDSAKRFSEIIYSFAFSDEN